MYPWRKSPCKWREREFVYVTGYNYMTSPIVSDTTVTMSALSQLVPMHRISLHQEYHKVAMTPTCLCMAMADHKWLCYQSMGHLVSPRKLCVWDHVDGSTGAGIDEILASVLPCPLKCQNAFYVSFSLNFVFLNDKRWFGRRYNKHDCCKLRRFMERVGFAAKLCQTCHAGSNELPVKQSIGNVHHQNVNSTLKLFINEITQLPIAERQNAVTLV